ncbi:3-ketoacyl-CoA synthase 5-like [Elaeis guineensis]|uniref:3-ketoacyl-CoA synthase 5-like n=1 Tax=Elaeis guineensis var. tenera TaxID=51953 RepID=UPI003C6D0365
MDIALRDHVFSCLLHLIDLFTLFLSISIEAYIFVHKWNPTYHLFPMSCMLLLSALQRLVFTPRQVYLVDFSCTKPPRRFRAPISGLLEHLSLIKVFDDASVAFMTKLITTAGMGDETYFPPSLHYIPPSHTHEDSIEETHMALFPALEDLLAKTNLSPRDIDVLVVNCSAFCPSPSLSSIVVHRFGMRDDVKTFSISGMGCSAGAIGIDVAQSLLRVHRKSYAVVLSTEILSTGWYSGRDRRKLLLNCYFRMGGSAVLLTNRREAKWWSKYRLVRLLRTQRAFDDKSYLCAIREEDSEGITGFSIERNLLTVAAQTLRSNAVALGSSILPLREKLRYGVMKLCNKNAAPDFRAAIKHYCLPSSGRAVMKEIGKGLGVGGREMEPALMTFHRFGNQSSASMWYQLAYMEAKGRVGRGERVWQLGMGTGTKCNSLVWECLRGVMAKEAEKGPWDDSIHRYPVGEGQEDL